MLLIEPIETFLLFLILIIKVSGVQTCDSRRTCTGHVWSVDPCHEGPPAPVGHEVHPVRGQNISPVAQGTQLLLITNSLFSLVDRGCGTESALQHGHHQGGRTQIFY